MLIPLLFGAGLLGTDDTTSSMCGAQTAAQPGVSADAEDGIPATYLRLYQQAGRQYGMPWNVLAAIGKRESDHGRDTSPGSGVRTGANDHGAAGPMQIGIGGKATNNWGSAPRHPASQKTGSVGVDGNKDGWADVHDPADAIPGAARYLLDHGAPGNLYQAVYAYNPDPDYSRADLLMTYQPRPAGGSGGTLPVASCADNHAAQTRMAEIPSLCLAVTAPQDIRQHPPVAANRPRRSRRRGLTGSTLLRDRYQGGVAHGANDECESFGTTRIGEHPARCEDQHDRYRGDVRQEQPADTNGGRPDRQQ